ncbi:MAG: hypothetical protein MR411_04240 [Tenericutes bacterium]|nr:hypothetical protein [Mycoplasmatota bacterium]
MNENLEKAKSILELDEFNKLKNQIDSNNYTIEEINNLINEFINDHNYNKNKKNEYNESNNIKIEVIDRDKNNIIVKIDGKNNGILKNYKNKSNNDLEVAFVRIAKLLSINTIDAKRFRFENKNYVLEIDNEYNYEKMSNKLKIEISSITNDDDIKKIIEYPLQYIDNKEDYFKMILFNIIIGNKNISLDSYRIKNNRLLSLDTFIYEDKNKDVGNNDVILNNKIINVDSLLNNLFSNYFNYFEKFLYLYFNKNTINKINEIMICEVQQKEEMIDIIYKRFMTIYKLYNNKIKAVFSKNGINSTYDLYNYLDNNVEFGTTVNINNIVHEIPYGTIEAEEGRNNKRITYDNPDIIYFLNEYYNNYKDRINPSNIDLTQMFKSFSSVNDIMNNQYKFNYPMDIFNYNVASSAEQMEFIVMFLEANNIKYKRLVFSSLVNNVINESHFFVTYNIDNDWFYFENALTDFKGIYKYNSFDELIDVVISKMIYTKELNPYKEININKYILNEIEKIDMNLKIDDINNMIYNSKKIDISNSIKTYQKENELRKKVIEGHITAHNFDSDYKIIKPEDNYDNNNEYKEEYLRLLKENIFHICYKDENGKYFKVNDKEKEEKKYDLSIIDEKKEEKQSYSLKYTIIITIIIVLSTVLWKTLIN